MLNVFGWSKSESGLSVGVLNFTLNVSADRGENIPLSKLPTPTTEEPLLEKLRRGVSGRGRALFDATEFEEPWYKDELVVVEDEEEGVCMTGKSAVAVLVLLEAVGDFAESDVLLLLRLGVTKLV